jgi:hypothetical protein
LRPALLIALLILPSVLSTACGDRDRARPTSPDPVTPGSISAGALERFVQSLREQGLRVNLEGQISPDVNHFFSVTAHLVRVNDAQVNAFEYPTEHAAAMEAASISPEGQPNPRVAIDWISTPRFYRSGSLIVLYVGCSTEIAEALRAVLGEPLVVGRNGFRAC